MSSLKILIIEDNAGDVRLIQEMLRESNAFQFELETADRLSAGLKLLEKKRFDIVLLDLGLPDSQGTNTIIRAVERFPRIPVVVLTGLSDEAAGVESISKGAQDYLVKGNLNCSILARCIRHAIGRKQIEEEKENLIKELNSAKHELEQKANELARSNTELERFAFAAAHDLKEPVIVIESFIRRLQRTHGEKLDDKANELIKYVIDGTTRMQTLISDLLAYARIGSKESDLRIVDSGSIIKQAISNLQVTIEKSGALITYDCLPTITADQAQLVQLFQNLIGNAIKFCNDNSPHIHISAEQKENEWIFSVSDNGIGIAPDDVDRIFEIFQRLHSTSKYPGTGIGLAICKKIAERHGGRIWVEAEMGKGSIFYFTIRSVGA
ncbi:MAG: response regulator [Candidatus Schekmanbacteria bacterium]|nr:response regulator [Candidatus Schekmanbacteria bacterium]